MNRIEWLDIALAAEYRLGVSLAQDKRVRRLRKLFRTIGEPSPSDWGLIKRFGAAVSELLHGEPSLAAMVADSIIAELKAQHPPQGDSPDWGAFLLNDFFRRSEALLQIKSHDNGPRVSVSDKPLHQISTAGLVDWINTPYEIQACDWCGVGFKVLRARGDLKFCSTSCRGASHKAGGKA